ncbi:MAG: helicase-associated domain-containing protein [Intrasporangium sp.]|uniref:helicase-associated domain-containing protein n=1 Tax=Intrasporangium sp. TaxID=1925024 RepID=UPI002647D085|nr:helicase-associated domain-containing protein [Intrasporangium sp.]MDN5797031.1 helicase-associated domain-containing protein [Intrasporangium sp.]
MAVPSRSLADDIRRRTDDELVALVLARPDLARPAPADLTGLAARASTKASAQRAVEALDRGHLQVLESLVVAGDDATRSDVRRLLGVDEADDATVRSIVEDLWRAALLWRAGGAFHVVRTVPEVLGRAIAGLGAPIHELRPSPSRATATIEDPAALAALLEEASPAARAVLGRMAWGPPLGVPPTSGAGQAAVRWLLEHHLLVTVSVDRVALPREVGLALRNGRLHRTTSLSPPDLPARTVPAVDAVAGGAASELLTRIDEVAEAWGAEPPRVLRGGGLSVRDLRHTTALLDVEPERTGFLLEVMYAAQLVADDGEVAPVWAPTPALDEWAGAGAGHRWAALASAWLRMTRAPHLVGHRAAGTSGANALGPDLQWPPIRAIRREALTELAALPPGGAPGAQDLTRRLLWRRPLRSGTDLAEAVTAVLREAEWLGVTGRGALSTAGRALVGAGGSVTRVESAASAMAAELPAPVEHILVQADLTAIAPGPLVGSLAAFMRLAAEVESRGGATVYRFTTESLRRALDAGQSAAEVLDTLRRASRTALPQPLEYLVTDVARRHGRTRVGGCAAYIRSDDQAILEAMLVARDLGPLLLRRIAPTVLVSQANPAVVRELLHDAGFSPVMESVDGSVLATEVPRRRARGRRAPGMTVSAVDEPFTRSLVAGLRTAEEAADARRAEEEQREGPSIPVTDPVVTLALLRDAAADRHGVWVGVTDRHGARTRELIHPRRVDGGQVRATDAAGHEKTYSVHRITGATLA